MPRRRVQELAGLVGFDGAAPSVPDEVIDELWQRVAEINGGGGLWRRCRPADRVLVRLGSRESESRAELLAGAKSPHGRLRVLFGVPGPVDPRRGSLAKGSAGAG